MSKLKQFKIITCLMLLITQTTTVNANEKEVCQKDNTLQTTPASNFVGYPNQQITDPNVRDIITGLIWQRCSVGQSWDANKHRCLGTATLMTWQQALEYARDQGDNWRLPTIKELAASVDYQCIMPAFNQQVFPDTPEAINSGFWSSTPSITRLQINQTKDPLVWFVDTAYGGISEKAITFTNYVRLVKRIP